MTFDPRTATLAQMFEEVAEDAPSTALHLVAHAMFAYGAASVLLMLHRADPIDEIDEQVDAMTSMVDRLSDDAAEGILDKMLAQGMTKQ